MIDLSRYTMTVAQAAELRGVDVRTIQYWCKQGEVDCIQLGTPPHSLWMINPVSLGDKTVSKAGRKKLKNRR